MIIKLERGSVTDVYDRVNHYRLKWEDEDEGHILMTRDGFPDNQALSIRDGDDIFIMSESGKTIDRIQVFNPDHNPDMVVKAKPINE